MTPVTSHLLSAKPGLGFLFPIQALPPPFRPDTRQCKWYLPAPKAWEGNGSAMMGELRLELVPAFAPPQTLAYRTVGTK